MPPPVGFFTDIHVHFYVPFKTWKGAHIPRPVFASRWRELLYPHGNMKRKWNSVPRLLIFFSSSSWVNECQMFSQNVFISSGQPVRILFIIAQRPRGHNIRRLWSFYMSPILWDDCGQRQRQLFFLYNLLPWGQLARSDQEQRWLPPIPSQAAPGLPRQGLSHTRLSNCQKEEGWNCREEPRVWASIKTSVNDV